MAVTTGPIQGSTPIGQYDDAVGGHRPEVVIAGSGSGTSSPEVQGNIAHDAADQGKPVAIGGYASDTAPTEVTLGDRVKAWFTRIGALAVFNAYGLNPTDDSVGCAPFSIAINGSHTRVTNLVAAVTLSPPAGATHLVIQASKAALDVRLTYEGTTPTVDVGFLMVGGDPEVRIPIEGKTVKAIEKTSGAEIQYHWEGA